MQLPGTPSDEVDDVLATGRGDITTLFVSMATRHPDGPTPSICAGTPSITVPNSTGCRPCAPPCGWCRRRRAAPPAPRGPTPTTRSTM